VLRVRLDDEIRVTSLFCFTVRGMFAGNISRTGGASVGLKWNHFSTASDDQKIVSSMNETNVVPSVDEAPGRAESIHFSGVDKDSVGQQRVRSEKNAVEMQDELAREQLSNMRALTKKTEAETESLRKKTEAETESLRKQAEKTKAETESLREKTLAEIEKLRNSSRLDWMAIMRVPFGVLCSLITLITMVCILYFLLLRRPCIESVLFVHAAGVFERMIWLYLCFFVAVVPQ